MPARRRARWPGRARLSRGANMASPVNVGAETHELGDGGRLSVPGGGLQRVVVLATRVGCCACMPARARHGQRAYRRTLTRLGCRVPMSARASTRRLTSAVWPSLAARRSCARASSVTCRYPGPKQHGLARPARTGSRAVPCSRSGSSGSSSSPPTHPSHEWEPPTSAAHLDALKQRNNVSALGPRCNVENGVLGLAQPAAV